MRDFLLLVLAVVIAVFTLGAFVNQIPGTPGDLSRSVFHTVIDAFRVLISAIINQLQPPVL